MAESIWNNYNQSNTLYNSAIIQNDTLIYHEQLGASISGLVQIQLHF